MKKQSERNQRTEELKNKRTTTWSSRTSAKRSAWIATVAISSLAMTIILFSGAQWAHAQPLPPPNTFPRTANYYLSTIKRADYERLARYDLLILMPEIQFYNPDFFAYARGKNPDIIILPYIYSSAVNVEGLDDPVSDLKRAFYALAEERRFLHRPDGGRIAVWMNSIYSMNMATDWVDAMPPLVKQKVLDTGLWDGIFYDVVDASITHLASGDIDINNDGARDDGEIINRLWQEGMARLLKQTRELIGTEKIIVINGNSLPAYQPFVNGRLFESFPTPWEGRGAWSDSIRSYLVLSPSNFPPPTSIINTTTRDRGSERDYKTMRFGLTSALLGNGYSSFDFGITSHAQVWWYDEYDAALGRPLSQPVNVLGGGGAIVDSVWRRDFEQGIAFVNATSDARSIALNEEFERLHGIQDPVVNDGSVGNDVMLPARDGVILLRPIGQLFNTAFANGSFARIFTNRGNVSGNVKRTGFFTYQSAFQGKAVVAELSANQHPKTRLVVADGRELLLYRQDLTLWKSVLPYGPRFKGTFTFTLSDITGDGRPEIVTIPTSGGTAHVRSFTLDGILSSINFIAGPESVSGGSIAVLPANDGEAARVVIGAPKGRAPIVSIYNAGGKLLNRWGAFEKSFSGGLSVATGNVDGSGIPSVIVGRASNGAAEVRIFALNGKLLGLFHAFSFSSKSGVNVLTNDIDGDGRDEIVATQYSL